MTPDDWAEEWAINLHAHFKNCQHGGRRGGPHPDSTFVAIAKDKVEQLEREAIRGFVDKILHGHGQHRRWLKDAGEAFIAGQPMPEEKFAP